MIKRFEIKGLINGEVETTHVDIDTTNTIGTPMEDAYDYAYSYFDKAVISVKENRND